ncbi:MAG: hypothetical protein Q8P76_01895 [bacterium]|nr:hypothetical protein [bacterium]
MRKIFEEHLPAGRQVPQAYFAWTTKYAEGEEKLAAGADLFCFRKYLPQN